MVLEWLAQYKDLIYAPWIIAVTFLVGKIIFSIFRHYMVKKRGKEGTIHEHITEEVRFPFYLIVVSMGLYYATRSLNFLDVYRADVENIFSVAWVLIGVFILQKAINAVITWYASREKKPLRIEKTSLMSLKNLVSIFIYAIAAIIILGQLGVEITPLLASLGIGGLAIALALQPTLSNYFAGVYIASDKTIRLGDYIEIDEKHRGYIDRVTWRSIWIKTMTGNTIIIPNSKVAESIIINYSQPRQAMFIRVPLGVSYKSNLDKVERVTLRVAKKVLKETEGGIEGEEPFVRFKEFGDSNIILHVFFKIKWWDKQYVLKDEFIKALKKEFDKEKIEISFPSTNVYMRK